MVKPKHLFLAAIVLVTGILIVLYFSESEEKKVKKQFALLSEMASKDPDESIIKTAQKVHRIGTLFDNQCELKTDIEYLSGTFTPEEIMSYGARVRAMFSRFSLQFSDLKIEFPEKGLAKVTLTILATGTLTDRQRVDEVREVESTLRKIERKWLFNSFRVVEVLKR